MTDMINAFFIQAARVFPEIGMIKDGFMIPPLNPKYIIAAIIDGYLMASKNGKDWVLAVSVHDGREERSWVNGEWMAMEK